MHTRIENGMAATRRFGALTRLVVSMAIASAALALSGHGGAQVEAIAVPSSPVLLAGARAATHGQSATRLPDGRWLLIGGERDGAVSREANLVDAASNQTYAIGGGLRHARSGHTATVMPDGTVLVLGGVGADGRIVGVAERLDARQSAFESVALPLVARSEHTATLLTDGRLLIVGGLGGDGEPVADVELFDIRADSVDRFDARVETVRFGHLASLLPSAPVLVWGGLDRRLQPALRAELFEPDARAFRPLDRATTGYLPDASVPNAVPSLTGVHPERATPIALDQTLTLRFSTPLAGESLSGEAVTLIGPNGRIPLRVVAAEGGLLAFVTPAQDLNPHATYTLFVRGARSLAGLALPFTVLDWRTGSASDATQRAARAPSTERAATEAQTADVRLTQPPATPSDGPTTAMRVAGAAADGVSNQASDYLTIGSFTLADAAVTPCGKAADENWIPDIAAVPRKGWASGRPASVIPRELARVAPAGETAIAGQILRLNGQPLPGVVISAGGRSTRSDQHGLFLLRGVAPGSQVLTVDGSVPDCDGAEYGYYEINVDAQPWQTTVLPFSIWLPKIDVANAVTLAAPTTNDVVITHPQMPGLEVRIPAGTLIRDRAGRIVTRVSITPIPVDRAPYPMPEFAEFPVYFTLQPGNARLEGADGRPRQAQVVYPNYAKFATDDRIVFWSYDASEREWHPYGMGRVSADETRILPDDGVGLYQFTGFSIGANPNPPPCDCDCCGAGSGGGSGDGGSGGDSGPGSPEERNPADPNAGDPVHTASGQFVHTHTDLRIADVMPIALRRLHYSQDGRSREFGRGMISGLEPYVYNPNPASIAEFWLATANGGRVVFTCANGCINYSLGLWVASSDPGHFFGATMRVTTGWVITTRDGTVYEFNKLGGRVTSITDRNGNVTRFFRTDAGYGSLRELNKIQSPNGRFIEFTYDANLRITRAEDNAGRAWTYGYDAAGRMTTATDPAGGQWQYTWDGATDRMLAVRDPRGNLTVTNQYDGNGRVIRQTHADASTSEFAYTLNGTTVAEAQVTDRRGVVRKIEFGPGGRVARNTFALGRPEQQVTTFTRQAGSNLLTRATDALGRNTDYTYDAKGNVLTSTRLAGTGSAVTTTYTYTADFSQVASIRDPLNRTTTFAYDAVGNLTRITDPLAHQTNLTYDVQGQVLTVRNALNHTTTYTYTAGVLASVKDPLNRTTYLYPDALGRVVRVVDPLGNASTTTYDLLGRVTASTDALGGSVRYEYDAYGNLTAHVDQRGNRTRYGYDALNRQESRSDALGNADSYGYDAGSKLAQVTDRQGQVSGFAYDALHRRVQAGFGATPGSPTAYTSTISYAFDAGNRLLSVADSQAETVTRAYDGLDRLTQESTAQGAVSYAYYANGLRQTMTVAGQAAVSYAYDAANRLTSIVQGSQTVAFTYDNANRRSRTTLPNGVAINYTYDNASQLTGITYVKGATTLGNLSYTYDAAGRRTSIGGSFARTELPAAIATTSHNANNQLLQWGGQGLTYDRNGNLTGDGIYTYGWNARNQLVELRQGATTVASYEYDGFGRRQRKAINGVTTQFVYDGWNFAQERDQANAVTANVLSGLGLDEVYARIKGAATSSLLTDHLGTIIAEADAAGVIQTSYSYEPYGKTTQTGVASDNSQRYTGREQDTAELYYYRARYYAFSTGRFAAEDPIEFAAGANLYAYVGGDPINLSDPSGKNPAAAFAAACVAAPIPCAVGGVVIGAVYWACKNATPTPPPIPRDDEPKDCKRIGQQCREYCSDCQLPTKERCSQGFPFFRCVNDCLRERGC